MISIFKGGVTKWHRDAEKLGDAKERLAYCLKHLDEHYDRSQILDIIPNRLSYAEVWGAVRSGLAHIEALEKAAAVKESELR